MVEPDGSRMKRGSERPRLSADLMGCGGSRIAWMAIQCVCWASSFCSCMHACLHACLCVYMCISLSLSLSPSPMPSLPRAESWVLGWRRWLAQGGGMRVGGGGEGGDGKRASSPQGQPQAAAIRLREERRKPPLPELGAQAPALVMWSENQGLEEPHQQKPSQPGRAKLEIYVIPA